MLDIHRIRDQFPITRQCVQVLGRSEPKPLIYLDHGASTRPPSPVPSSPSSATPRKAQQYVLTWKPGGVLETQVAGVGKTPNEDKAFAAAVFGIWLGEEPIQEDIKKGLVSRAGELIK